MRCLEYTGLACVNGACPNALAKQYPEHGYNKCTCEECAYYKGCDDCCHYGIEINCCSKPYRTSAS